MQRELYYEKKFVSMFLLLCLIIFTVACQNNQKSAGVVGGRENPSVVDQYDDYVQQKEDAEAQGKKFMWINSVGTYRAIQFYEDGTYQYVNLFGFSIEDGSDYYDFIHDGETMVIGEKEYDFELDGDTLYLGQNELIRTSDSLEDYVVE